MANTVAEVERIFLSAHDLHCPQVNSNNQPPGFMRPVLARSYLTQSLAPVSRNLAQVAEIGLQALNDLRENRPISTEVRQKNIDFLKVSAKPQAVLLLMVAPPVQLLIEATKTE